MDEFTAALKVVVETMRLGAATHRAGEWTEHPADFHIGRAAEHLRLLRNATSSRITSPTPRRGSCWRLR
jgi:hypothetical protein